jgi:hypothetical protein
MLEMYIYVVSTVAGWVLGELPSIFKRLQSVEFNTFAAYHGKDRADSVGALIVKILREKQSTDEGLQARDLQDAVARVTFEDLLICVDKSELSGGVGVLASVKKVQCGVL